MAKKNIIELSVQDVRKIKKGDFITRHIPDHEIDCSDIPELTEEQLRQFKPVSKRFKKKLAR